jgi:histone deacetylase 1/2
LGEALYVPKLKFGLISISYFDKQGFKTVIEGSALKVYDTEDRLHIEGYLNNNLYYLNESYVERMLYTGAHSSIQRVNLTEEKSEIDKRLYNIHHKLGHISMSKLKLAVKNELIDGLNMSDIDMKKGKIDFCYDCMRGKMKADPSGDSTEHQHEWKMFEKIAVDYKGPYSIHSYHHYNGFYLFSDYYTDYVWVYLVKSKSEFIKALRAFYEQHNVLYKVELKVLQGDFDTMHKDEVVKEFLRENKVTRLQLSAPYNHSQNGQIERDMQSVLNVTRTLMSSSGCPNWFWEFAVIHACLLINYTPTSNSATGYKTPHELVTGKKPNASKLVSFYAPGVYHVKKEEMVGRNSLSKYMAAPCRYLGVNRDSPANYLIYDILRK